MQYFQGSRNSRFIHRCSRHSLRKCRDFLAISVSFKGSMTVSNHSCFCRTFLSQSLSKLCPLRVSISLTLHFPSGSPFPFISLTFQSVNFCQSPLIKTFFRRTGCCIDDICSVLSEWLKEMQGGLQGCCQPHSVRRWCACDITSKEEIMGHLQEN